MPETLCDFVVQGWGADDDLFLHLAICGDIKRSIIFPNSSRRGTEHFSRVGTAMPYALV